MYHPAKEKVTKDILKRAEVTGCEVLVILSDIPFFGFRPRDTRNDLSMPPRMTSKNILDVLTRPEWAIKTLLKGILEFETLKPYMPKNIDLSQLGSFMDATFSGRLNEGKISRLREMWKGKVVIKGVESLHDIEIVCKLGWTSMRYGTSYNRCS